MKFNNIIKKRIVWIGLMVILLLLVGLPILAFYRHPLGPALSSVVPTASLVTKPTEGLTTTVPTANPTATVVVNNTANFQVNSSAVCGETGVWNVLILGSDAADLRGEKGSDLTRAALVDFPDKKVNIYAFTRDLWVTTTTAGFSNPAIDADRLGVVFYEARRRSTQPEDRDKMVDGTNATAKVMEQNFSLHFDHYLTIDLSQIPAMVDLVGGIPMYVPERTTDPWIGMVIPAGQQTLNGKQVEAYARAIPDSDFGRIQRDNLLVQALRQKLLDPSVWLKIPQLYEQIKGAMVTDLSPEQIVNLACLMKITPKESIIQDEVKPEWTSPGPQGSLLWDSDKVSARLKELGLIR